VSQGKKAILLYFDQTQSVSAVNRLQHETSPYLLQHADNPVDWYPWGEEAFQVARMEDKPLLVSVGYSTCHWCHVMERESFEDPDVAGLMNMLFVNVKVDREERPDVDQMLMDVCQLMTGSGGWPLHVFLTPEGKPFYAGTYFPPRPMPGRPSWVQVLHHLGRLWRENRQTIYKQAQRIEDALKGKDTPLLQLDRLDADQVPWSEEQLHAIYKQLLVQADVVHGGFGSAPKFPQSMALDWLMHYYFYTHQAEALQHALFSLEQMVRGGIYDQLAGGFARYATDEHWLVPHFEKMLYDNALLLRSLTSAWQLTKKDLFAEAVAETIEWVKQVMRHPEGGFYAALDADSEGEEGKYYVWTKAEIEEVLGEQASWFCEYYGVSEQGNWEDGKNILHRKYDDYSFAEKHGISVEVWKRHLAAAKKKLLLRRGVRVPPGRDDKILLDWNMLMVTSLLRAGTTFGCQEWVHMGLEALSFAMQHLRQAQEPAMYHSWKDGQAKHNAYLDDYACLIEALIEAAQVTGDWSYLVQAGQIVSWMWEEFLDEQSHLFYFTPRNHDSYVQRRIEFFDSATPSGNALMACNLQRLALLMHRPEWAQQAERMLRVIMASVVRYPLAMAHWAVALANAYWGIPEIAVVGVNALEKATSVMRSYIPEWVLMFAEAPDEQWPLLSGRAGDPDDALIYLCRQYVCLKPVRSAEELMRQLRPNQ